MARKSTDATLGGVVLVGGILWAFTGGARYLNGVTPSTWSIIAVAIAVVTTFVLLKTLVRNYNNSRAGKSAARKAAAAINEHLPSLVRRKAQLVRSDPYGKPRLESWAKEMSYFIDEHVKPRLEPREYMVFMREQQSDILMAIHMRVEEEAQKNPAFLTFSDDMTPTEFEEFCADELRRAGWNARVTLQSRDQGVDVIAEKSRVRVVLQCKLYARPVGNKAVQEAAAARAHERADFGVVVTNHRYTQDAEQLASTNNILLLHYSDLRNLATLTRANSPAPISWYYDDGKEQVGPLHFESLAKAIAAHSNPRELFVWRSEFSDWKSVNDVPELKNLIKDKSKRIRFPFISRT